MDTGSAQRFPTTHWTLVHEIQNDDPERSARAMEMICQAYWYPIYAFLRRAGHDPEDAEDLAQDFFSKLISENVLQRVRQERGRLRTFFLTVLSGIRVDEFRKRSATKRSAGNGTVELDHPEAEERYAHELATTDDPETLYLRAWARGVFDTAKGKLRIAFKKEGRTELFDKIEPYLTLDESSPPPFSKLARDLDSTEPAVKQLVYRVRRQLRVQLERDVARTVIKEEDIDREMEWLRGMLQSAE